MSKVSGTYPSLSRGVNQQPFEARLEGQHGEQVNLWSDPVFGLTRRRGTVLQHTTVDNPLGPSYHELETEALKREYREWRASFRTVPYTVDGRKFLVHYPSKRCPSWISESPVGPSVSVKVTEKIDRDVTTEAYARIVPVLFGSPGNKEYSKTVAAFINGFSGAVQIGRHLLLYPNDAPFPNPAPIDAMSYSMNGNVSIEVKHGVPNRTYRISATYDGVVKNFSYTTPSSSYSGTLDTSDIPFSDPDYQKKVNDRVNAYNSAVTAWITTAAQQTRPSYIMSQLAAGIEPFVNGVGGNVFYVPDTSYAIIGTNNGRARGFTVSDGIDGSNFLVNEMTVPSVDKLSSFHAAGKIMQVRPNRGDQAFYMKAVADPPTAYGKVRWEETSRLVIGAPIDAPWFILSHNPHTGVVGIANGAPDGLDYLSGPAILNFPADDARRPNLLPRPNYRLVGDEDSSPTPAFFGKKVTWVGMFQDRLAFASGGTVNFSEVGNYFNFWRTQTLTVPDKDPVEVYALGSEADTIRHSVIFDRSLLLFGESQQYSIDGRNPLTPSTSTVIQSSSIEGATDAPPIVGRDLVFFAKRREDSTEVFQMEVGDVSDTSNFTGLGLQLSDYLPGKPSQLLFVSSPSTLFVRTSEAPHSIFVFKFIDQGKQRLMDSWSRFDYHPAFGLIVGMFYHDDAIYLRVDREAWVQDGVTWRGANGAYGFDVLERQSLLPRVSGMPYLDSIRRGHTLWTATGPGIDFITQEYPFLSGVFTRDKVDNVLSGTQTPPKNKYWLHGHSPAPNTLAKFNTVFADIPSGEAERDTNYYVLGLPFESYVELTSPVRRDQNGQPIMQGRLTVNRLDVYYKDAGGFEATVTSRYGITEQHNNFDWSVTDTAYGKITALRFNGRLLGDSLNMVGVIPITSGNTPVFVGREAKDYVCKIGARSWMPLSITRVTWTGQWFLNHRFV